MPLSRAQQAETPLNSIRIWDYAIFGALAVLSVVIYSWLGH